VPGRRAPSLTIGDVAAFAGVTVRAVRHYHKVGLLPEPPRDGSGYRRYQANAFVALIRIRALSQAGVPLARVRELLGADPDAFAAALAEIDNAMRDEIDRLETHRRSIAQLANVDALALPDEVVAYLSKLRRCGFSDRMIDLERDQWLLVSAHAPDQVGDWAAQKATMLDDETLVRVYKEFDAAFEWQPGDPRLERLADDLLALFAQTLPTGDIDPASDIDDTVIAMLDEQSTGASPAWRHLTRLVAERAPTPISRVPGAP
jgi:DNA-binding transcriptional MerR regulator